MLRKLNLALALAAGLAGGLLSRYVGPMPVHAQSSPPAEIQAQSFTLVDAAGNIVGTFQPLGPHPQPRGAQPQRWQPQGVVLLDSKGHEIWRGGPLIRPLTQ